MPPIAILDNPLVTLGYHSDKKIVKYPIHQFIRSAEYAEFLVEGAAVLGRPRARRR